MSPLVSVIIPTFNRMMLLTETLDSVFNQSYRPLELVVVDDGSSDETAAVIESWLSQHPANLGWSTQFIRQENSGAPAARNNGFKHSGGVLIQFFDSDDLMHPDQIHLQVESLEDQPNAGFSWTQCVQFNDVPDWSSEPICGEPSQNPLLTHIRRGLLNTPNTLLRRRLIEQGCGWNEALPNSQDWEFMGRQLLRSRGVCTQSSLVAVRIHEKGQITSGIVQPAWSRGYLAATDSLLIHATRRLDEHTDEGDLHEAFVQRYAAVAYRALKQGWVDIAKEASRRMCQLAIRPRSKARAAFYRSLCELPRVVAAILLKT